MATITPDIPEDAWAGSRQSAQDFAHELRLAAAIYWYATGRISQEKAARLAGLDRTEFILALSREKVDIFQNDLDQMP